MEKRGNLSRQRCALGALVGALVGMWCAGVLASDRAGLSAASDATPWFLGGFSAVLIVEPESLGPWRLSAELWGMEFPEALVELTPGNRGEGWQRRVDVALALQVDYGLGEDGQGWHVGVGVDGLKSTVGRKTFVERGSFWSVEVIGRVGYRWFPLEDVGLFINPWAGFGPLLAVEETPQVGGERFKEAPVQGLATIHAGWRL